MSARLKISIGVAIIISVVGWMGWTGIQTGKSYYITVDQLEAMGEKAHERRLRVAGLVQDGSIRRENGKLHFILGLEEVKLPVVFTGRGTIPDTFKDGVEAVIEGSYSRDGVFYADHIQAKCASRYEADYDSLQETGDVRHPQGMN